MKSQELAELGIDAAFAERTIAAAALSDAEFESRIASAKHDGSICGVSAVIDTAPSSVNQAVVTVPTWAVHPSPENDRLYRPIDPADPEIVKLAESIREHGVQEPILLSADNFIISGHRRYAASLLAGLDELPCRFREDVSREGTPDLFLRLLRECNRQRVKSMDEQLREEVVSSHPDEAYRRLIEHRRQKSDLSDSSDLRMVELGKKKNRKIISAAKIPMLNAVKMVIEDRRKYWPLSDRQIHYPLLNDPPLRHASKPDSVYVNNRRSYKDLCDLLTRARLVGQIPWESIADETRPLVEWNVSREPGAFIADQVGNFLSGYWRDLLQSQPNHIEVVGEKLTVKTILQKVVMDYTMPLTLGRGFCSIDPRHRLLQRFAKSGKEKLVVLLVSDFDPDGERIAESYAHSMRDDFGVAADKLIAVKVALNPEHIRRFNLPAGQPAKKKSPNYAAFVREHGENSWELEALPPESLAQLLRDAIESVVDRDALEHEREREKADAAHIETLQHKVKHVLGKLGAA